MTDKDTVKKVVRLKKDKTWKLETEPRQDTKTMF